MAYGCQSGTWLRQKQDYNTRKWYRQKYNNDETFGYLLEKTKSFTMLWLLGWYHIQGRRLDVCKHELELFSISTISLHLDVVSIVIINTIQIDKTINFANPIETTLIHKVSSKIIFSKKLEVAFEDKVYPKTYYHRRSNQV
jgi:hypothetical protein